MLDSNILETLIALIFIYLLLSLGVSTIVEIIAQLRSLRAKKLQAVIKELLKVKQQDGEFLGDKFYKHSIIKNFGKLTKKKIPFLNTQLPSYLTANNFSTVLLDTLMKNQENDTEEKNYKNIKIESLVKNLPDCDLKETLNTFLKSANDDIEALKKKIEDWYDDTMVRFSGYYKRHTQLWLFTISLAFCSTLNVDTFSIVNKLSKDPDARLALVEQATQYVQDHKEEFSSPEKQQADTSNGKQFVQTLDSLRRNIISEDLNQARTTLQIGWSDEECKDLEFAGWLLKILGILITTIAIYLGAPFWFDILNKLTSLRSTGQKPK